MDKESERGKISRRKLLVAISTAILGSGTLDIASQRLKDPNVKTEAPNPDRILTPTVIQKDAPVQLYTPISNPIVIPSETSLISTEELRKKTEDKYGIALSKRADFRWEWPKEALAHVDDILPHFPRFFYTPDSQGRRLNLQLSSRTASCCFYTDKERTITVALTDLTTKENTSVGLAHEFTHLITMVPVPNASGGYTFTTPSAPIVETILNGSFTDLKPKITGDLRKKEDEFKNDWPKTVFFNQFKYGTSNIDEFIAVMGSNYVMSKQYFHEMYELFFSPETVKHLYSFTKDSVFQGKEYEIPIYKM